MRRFWCCLVSSHSSVSRLDAAGNSGSLAHGHVGSPHLPCWCTLSSSIITIGFFIDCFLSTETGRFHLQSQIANSPCQDSPLPTGDRPLQELQRILQDRTQCFLSEWVTCPLEQTTG